MSVKRVVFLDFDGVIRLIPSIEDDARLIIPPPEFDHMKMRVLAEICGLSDAKIVVSSDLRKIDTYECTDNRAEVERWLCPHIPRHMLHDDWATPIIGHRWQEIERWLSKHPEVTSYAILEDSPVHFENASEYMKSRIIWCNNRFGLTSKLAAKLDLLFHAELGEEEDLPRYLADGDGVDSY